MSSTPLSKAPTSIWRAALALIAVAGTFAWAAPASHADTISPTEYQLFSGQVASFTDPCTSFMTPHCSTEAPAASIAWGDGSGTSTASLTEGTCSLTGCTWYASGSHRYTEEGTDTVTVNWSDDNGVHQAGSVTSTAQVADAKPAVNVVDPSCAENSTFSGTVASFTDPGAGPSADWSATVHWWDGTTSQATVTPHPSAPFDVSASHLCGDAGNRTFTVTVTDEGGASQTVSDTMDVYDLPLNAFPSSFTAVEGQKLGDTTVANFVDMAAGPASDFTVTVNWGDGSTSAGSVEPATGGGYAVHASGHAYANEGSYQLTVTISDKDGASTVVHPSATVTDGPLTAGANSLSGTPGQPVSGMIGRFSDAGSGPASDFTATINWGDGSTGQGAIVADPVGGFDVNASHTYAGPGSYAVTISIVDAGGSQTSATSTATITTPKVTCVVPKLLGKTLAKAKAALARSHCRMGRLAHRHARKAARGRVISQGLPRGARRAAGTRVSLVMGR